MKLITYATHNTGYLDSLKISAKNNHFDLKILGYGKEWIGFTQKLNDSKDYLKTLDKNDLVCFVDGFDSIVLGSSNELVQKYIDFKTDLVMFSASRDNFIMNVIFGKINDNDVDKEYNRLNSGLYIGYVHKIIELFDNVCNYYKCTDDKDDQELLTLYYNQCKNCLLLDTDNILFYNLEFDQNILLLYLNVGLKKQDEEKLPLKNNYYHFENGRIVIKNKYMPVIIQGSANSNLDNFTDALNLPPKIKENRNYFEYSTKKFIKKIKNQYPVMCTILLYFIKIFHQILALFIYFFVFFSNNREILMFIILLNMITVIQWYVFGNCVLTPIENMLEDNNFVYEDGTQQSFMVYYPSLIFGKDFMFYFFSFMPFVTTSVALYRINKSCGKNKR